MVVMLAFLAAETEPFGVQGVSFVVRFLFWLVLIGAAAVSVVAGFLFVHRKAALQGGFLRDALIAVAIAALFVPLFWGLLSLLHLQGGEAMPDFTRALKYGAVFSTGIVVVRRGLPALDSVLVPPGDAPQPRLHRRLPDDFTGRVLRLTVRDHFVDVVTTDGTFTVRSRFADAIDEMEPVVGHCTHRSHWVARDAIESVERAGGKIHLRLVNGDRVPVSRKYRPGLEKAGLV
ncbi:transcriptional regulator, LytTR family [Cribrihabitans marinus]|uniref:Transcriptional regulator, LytTR family n=1 Tax=Cribrihabitans marinus TaxID=1227549 RepID=A0A1H7AKF6_9RHOB|nr:LytTR family DNA-binding domain-containing protein [Cribrihabitans marinus]GGH31975.1 hypothetical protein GCM10010973_23130 [Cribrihabitans marinus]SEJ66079.1 transcriptional regulator, LytTR family [Cribrihabitans marinus]